MLENAYIMCYAMSLQSEPALPLPPPTRYEECKEKLVPFLKKVGFNPKKDIHFMPCSGLTGANLKDPVEECTWYTYVSPIWMDPSLNPALRQIDIPTISSIL